jgi:pimeloyl-ACP methyl ester carboxylesterase
MAAEYPGQLDVRMNRIISNKVISRDGTPITYYRSGAGSPLVIVPGTGAANPIAWPAVRLLEQYFSLYAVDRRGHGKSGDNSAYAIEREFEDIAAVIESIGEPANVLGHSFGGLLAFEAALLTRNIHKLVLYEPVLGTLEGALPYPEGFIDRLEALLNAGDREGVLTMHYCELVGMSSDEIEQFKASPAWPERLATAHTLPREMRAEECYTFDAQRFKGLHVPTLLLQGGDSPDFLKGSTEAVDAALPKSRIVVIPGQQHIAMYTAPELFVSEVMQFLVE